MLGHTTLFWRCGLARLPSVGRVIPPDCSTTILLRWDTVIRISRARVWDEYIEKCVAVLIFFYTNLDSAVLVLFMLILEKTLDPLRSGPTGGDSFGASMTCFGGVFCDLPP